MVVLNLVKGCCSAGAVGSCTGVLNSPCTASPRLVILATLPACTCSLKKLYETATRSVGCGSSTLCSRKISSQVAINQIQVRGERSRSPSVGVF